MSTEEQKKRWREKAAKYRAHSRDKILAREKSKRLAAGRSERIGRPPVDVAGKKFGRLLAIDRAGSDKSGTAMWNCVCDCGAKVVVAGARMKSGNTRSCGCLYRDRARIKHRKPYGGAFLHRKYLCYRSGAKRLGREFSIEESEVVRLMQSNCYYCGIPPALHQKFRKGTNGVVPTNGIDRRDNSAGYVHGNVVPCCWHCNVAKYDYSEQEFKDWICNVHKHWAAN